MSEGIFAYWPNRITALRFIGSFALFAVLGVYGYAETLAEANQQVAVYQTAFWLFILACASDMLDGYLARRDNQITAFGRVADSFCDKVLVMGTMVFLAVLPWSQHWFPAWIVVVILAREFLVTGLRGYVESIPGAQLPADWFGKAKMTLQCFASTLR